MSISLKSTNLFS